MSPPDSVNRPVKTTEYSIRILEALKSNPGQSLADLTEEFDIARSTIHRHLLTLEANDLIVRDEDGTFSLGLRLLDFGRRAREYVEFYDVARQQVDRLAEMTGEKVWLIAKEGDHSVHLYKAHGDNPLETSAQVGQRRNLHQLAAGKSILAFLPDDELDAILERRELEERTDSTITSEAVLREELADIRDRGYAFNIGESVTGLNAVGAPIRDEDGYPVGAISISGPAHRVKDSLLNEELPDKLLAALDEIHISLRYGMNG
ncbi:IclR family transcriptional regulator [Haloarchaeobius iranensis]|uniref:DNA-binding transcriptional regulator, IclR family n=1 Tax=Haloarchaeobius iranensis TaxID=996166 RepID=A0A1G9YK86_9EURY|nr:IclR family transcriptional regulator [Haloarchaeobius iranensis]SDN09450.1 DNA-binding transcriptional regulator, IclR family [Haloarchaeobius iranensis]